MSQNNNKNIVPNGILFSFFGVLVVGILYTIFLHGFLKSSPEMSFRKSAGIVFEKTKSLKLVFTSFPARSKANITEGEDLYKSRCAACHGQDIKGMPGNGPDLIDNDWWHPLKPTEKEIATVIINGVMPPKSRQGVMPARGGGLTDDQIFKIIYFLGTKGNSIIKDAK